MLEKNIESRLARECRKADALCVKLADTSMAGIPDRMIISKVGLVWFVELKAPGELPRPLQLKRHQDLIMRGCRVCVISSYQQIDELMKEMQELGNAF